MSVPDSLRYGLYNLNFHLPGIWLWSLLLFQVSPFMSEQTATTNPKDGVGIMEPQEEMGIMETQDQVSEPRAFPDMTPEALAPVTPILQSTVSRPESASPSEQSNRWSAQSGKTSFAELAQGRLP